MTRLNPYDSLAWVELAFSQTVSGHVDAAVRSMRVAINLAPHNRHVLRSAARLCLHMHDPAAAHDILARNASTPTDPWLVAAEIALSELAGRDPRFLKQGIMMINDAGFSPGHLTELAGSVGTVHLTEGNKKKSKRMFIASMRDPTGNALAQGEWASFSLGTNIVPPERLKAGIEAHEAMAFHAYRQGLYSEVPAFSEKWSEADPYSIRPFEFGSTAACYIDDFETGLRFADLGLKRRPASLDLLNHRAFALASLSRLNEAKATLKRIPRSDAPNKVSLIRAANEGLCAFREGSNDEALSLYRFAIDGFKRLGIPQASALARVYLAREARLASHTDAEKLLDEASIATKQLQGSEAAFVLSRLKVERLSVTVATPDPQEIERQKKLNRLRSVTFTTPGHPDWDGKPRKLLL